MSSLRFEIEQLMGLKFPEKSGEALIQFEESLEVPVAAEKLMKGYYRDPDSVKRGFQSLHQETSTILELLLPKRSKLREWSNDLPERPREAERFLKETSEQLDKQEKKRQQIERELLKDLRENMIEDMFPIPVSAFGFVSYQEPAVKIFLKPIGRTSEMMGLNPDQMRQVVRIHFLILLLIIAGRDLDGKVYERTGDEGTVQALTTAYTMRYLQFQARELTNSYLEWLKTWGGKPINSEIINVQGLEKARAAMIFWRRYPSLNWEECWSWVEQLVKRETLALVYDQDKSSLTVESGKRFFDY